MKKKSEARGELWPFAKKLWMIMRLCIFLILISMFTSMANKVHSQNTKLTLKMERVRIAEVFEAIEKQSNYYFFYNRDKFDDNRLVSLNMEGKTVVQILDELFKKQAVSYQIMDRNILIEVADGNSVISGQQQIKVSGKVTDSSGEPLPGVAVMVKGTTAGIVTDFEGQYQLTDIPANATLVFSFVGMKMQEVSVDSRTLINVKMLDDAIGIEEVVAVGYGTQKKVNLTGSLATVSSEELLKRPVANVQNLLQGRVTGLRIVQGSGQPGKEGASMQIRGMGTFSGAGNNPLVLIDGVVGALNSINPDNVESVTVLKDAASSAIYGARAANGVILVNTKSGKAGKVSFNYHGNVQIQQATRIPEFVTNSADFMTLWNESNTRAGITPYFTQEEINNYKNNVGDPNYPNTDWVDLMVNNALAQNHYLSVSGGDKTVFNFSIGYFDQDGIIDGHGYKRYDSNLSIRSKIKDKISVGANIGLVKHDTEQPPFAQSDLLLLIYGAGPNYGPYLPDGSGRYTSRYNSKAWHNRNPLAVVKEGSVTEATHRVNAQAYMDVELAKGLIWSTKGAIDFYNYFSKSHGYSYETYYWSGGTFADDGSPVNKGVKDSYSNSLLTTVYSTLEYSTKIASNHEIKLLGGYNQEAWINRNLSGGRLTFPTNTIQEINAGSTLGQYVNGSASEWAIQSLFGRANYDYKGKYLAEASVRYDGTSRIYKENRWGAFPSFSAGWRISEESFAKNLKWMENLKLRASWGQLGNQEIGLYPYQDIMSLTSYPFNSLQSGVYLGRLTDKNLKWETTTTIDLGVDMSVCSGLFTITADWFNKKTTDILYASSIPGSVGLGAPTVNFGAMRNNGFEFEIGHKNKIGDFKYSVDLNLSAYKNEVLKINAPILGNTIIKEGLSWGSHYLIEWIGIFQDENDIANSPAHPNKPKPGDLKFKDVSGPDGKPDGKIDANDRVVVDGAHPDFIYAGNIDLEWRNFDLSLFFQGVQGQKFYVNGWGIDPFIQGTPPTKDQVEKAWKPGSGINDYPALYKDSYAPVTGTASTFYLKDASYLRLKNIVIGYNVPQNFTKSMGLDNLRVYFSGDNIFTLTKYPGADPERTGGGRFATYPQLRTFTFGVRVKF